MPRGNEPAFRREAESKSEDLPAGIGADFRIRNAVVHALGVYRLQPCTDDAPLMGRLLVIGAIPPRPHR